MKTDPAATLKNRGRKRDEKTTYNIRNVLVSVTLYKRGPFGELRSCLIFDGQKNELFSCVTATTATPT